MVQRFKCFRVCLLTLHFPLCHECFLAETQNLDFAFAFTWEGEDENDSDYELEHQVLHSTSTRNTQRFFCYHHPGLTALRSPHIWDFGNWAIGLLLQNLAWRKQPKASKDRNWEPT